MMRPCLGLEDVGDTVWDVIILGAGPAGTIAAHQLATSGHGPCLWTSGCSLAEKFAAPA